VPARRLGVAAAFVDGALVPGDVVVDGAADGGAARIGAVGVAPAGARGTALPGFVDLQVNGFAGHHLTTADADAHRAVARALAAAGVTSFLTTVPTAAPERYLPAMAAAAEAAARWRPDGAHGARSLGVHLEGPFLSPVRAGAHPAHLLRTPDHDLVDRWASAGPLALVTLAPELPGALALIAHLRRRGVAVALGHTDATSLEAHAGFDAGASLLTHLWNAQRPIGSREPAAGGVALARADVWVCAIGDLVHVAAETLRFSAAAAGARFVAVTDAVSLAGLPAGTSAGGLTVAGGAVRTSDGALAGAAIGMDQVLRNLVTIGLDVPAAVRAVTAAPAAALGGRGAGRGRLEVGAGADVVVVDDGLRVVRTLVGGAEAT